MSLIRMTHPELPDASPAVTSEKAFARIWEPKGWVRVEEDEPDSVVASAPATPPSLPPRPTPPGGQPPLTNPEG